MTPSWERGGAKAVAGLCAALLLAGLVIVAAGAEGEPDRGDPSATAGVESIVRALDRRPRPDDRLPATAASQLASDGLPGTDVLASVKALSRGGWSLYLTPADEGVCASLADPQGGATMSCRGSADLAGGAPPPAAILDGCEATSPSEQPVCEAAIVWGVAPDGVRGVAVEVERGTAPRTRVVDNAYLIRVPLEQAPSTVRFSADRGSGTAAIPLPAVMN